MHQDKEGQAYEGSVPVLVLLLASSQSHLGELAGSRAAPPRRAHPSRPAALSPPTPAPLIAPTYGLGPGRRPASPRTGAPGGGGRRRRALPVPGPVVRAPRGSQAGGCPGSVLLEARRPQKASETRGVRCRGASPASLYQGARPSARHGVKARGILDRWRQEKGIASETTEPSQALQPPRVEPLKVSPGDDSPCSTECVRQIYTGTSACLSAVVSPAC